MAKNKLRKDKHKLNQKVSNQTDNSKLQDKNNEIDNARSQKPGNLGNSSDRHANNRGGLR